MDRRTVLSLKWRATLAASAATLALVIGVSAAQMHLMRGDLARTVSDQQFVLAARIAGELDSKLLLLKQALRGTARSLTPEILATPERIRAHFATRQGLFALFDDVLVLTPEGRMLADTPEVAGRMNVNLAGSPFLRRILESDEVMISEPSLGRTQRRPIVQLGLRVRDTQGRVVAVMLGVLRLTGGNFVADIAETRIGTNGYVMVLTRGERPVYIVHPNPARLLEARAPNAPGATGRALDGFEGTVEDTDSRGTRVLISFKSLKQAPWLLAVRVPVETAFAPLARAEQRVWAISLACALLALPLIWLGTRYLLGPLSDLRGRIERIGAGGTLEMLPEARQDEIGAVARAFNRMLGARLAAEARERDLARHQRLVADNLPALIAYVDSGLNVTYLNQALAALNQLDAEHFTPVPLAHLQGAGQYAESVGHIAQVLAGQRAEFIARLRIDGAERIFSASYVPDLAPGGGAARGYYVLMFDITEAEQARAALAEANASLEVRVRQRTAALEKAYAELETFSYSVAHHFRAPLRAMEGYGAMLLADDQALSADTRADLERIQAASRSMARLIDDLLRMASLPPAVGERVPVDLAGVARDCVAALRREQPERHVEVDIEPNLTAAGDARTLAMLLGELLANAWQHTAGRASALICVGRRADGVYFVEDNGAGFDMEYAERIFAPFERVHTGTPNPGTGIGLALARRIVEAHGGHIWASAAVGAGATFRFTLG
jgi:signal transduction histidine kinase